MCWWSVLDLCSFLCSKTQHCDAIQTITMFVHITPENCLLNPRYPRVPQTFCTYYCKYYRPAFLDQGRQFVNAMVLVGGTRHKWSWQLMFRFNKDCRWTEANPFMAGSIQSAAVTTSCIMLWYCRIPLKLLQGLSSMLQPWRESQYVFTVLIHFGHLNSSLQFASYYSSIFHHVGHWNWDAQTERRKCPEVEANLLIAEVTSYSHLWTRYDLMVREFENHWKTFDGVARNPICGGFPDYWGVFREYDFVSLTGQACHGLPICQANQETAFCTRCSDSVETNPGCLVAMIESLVVCLWSAVHGWDVCCPEALKFPVSKGMLNHVESLWWWHQSALHWQCNQGAYDPWRYVWYSVAGALGLKLMMALGVCLKLNLKCHLQYRFVYLSV